MNEAEIVELVALNAANALTSFTIYISFTFAFLTAAHFVGRQLSGMQVGVLCFVYLVSAAAGAGSTLANMDAMKRLIASSPNLLDESPWWVMESWTFFMGLIFSLGIIGCITFLVDVRRKRGAT